MRAILSSGGFAIVPLIIIAAVLLLAGGSGVVVYQNQQQERAENEALKEEIGLLKEAIESQESEEIASPTPTPEPSPTPAPKQPVVEAQKTQPAVSTAESVKVELKSKPESKLSKKEECEAKVLKARIEDKEKKQKTKQELYNHPALEALREKGKELNQAIQDADDLYTINANKRTLDALNETLDIRYKFIEEQVDKVFEDKYEKMLSDCLNS